MTIHRTLERERVELPLQPPTPPPPPAVVAAVALCEKFLIRLGAIIGLALSRPIVMVLASLHIGDEVDLVVGPEAMVQELTLTITDLLPLAWAILSIVLEVTAFLFSVSFLLLQQQSAQDNYDELMGAILSGYSVISLSLAGICAARQFSSGLLALTCLDFWLGCSCQVVFCYNASLRRVHWHEPQAHDPHADCCICLDPIGLSP